jgi:O-antigen/teichoic acid export membrane protein
VARVLGPAGRGETAATLAVYYILPILLAFGVPIELRRRAAVIGDPSPVVRTARRFSALLIAPAAVVAVVLYETLFAGFDGSARIAAAVGAALAPITVSWSLDLSVMIAQTQFRRVLILQLTQPIAYLLIVLGLVTAHRASTAGVIISNICASAATAGIALALNRASWRGESVPTRALLSGALRYAGSAAAEATSNRLDQALALPLIGAAQSGLYAIAVTVGALPLAAGQALGASYFRSLANADESRQDAFRAEAGRTGLAVGLIPALCLAIVSPFAVPLVFGHQFAPAIPSVLISLLGSIAMVAAYVTSNALAATGKGLRMTGAQTVALAVAVALLFVLGPSWGAIGAATASTASYWVLYVLLMGVSGVRGRRLVPTHRDLYIGLKQLFARH